LRIVTGKLPLCLSLPKKHNDAPPPFSLAHPQLRSLHRYIGMPLYNRIAAQNVEAESYDLVADADGLDDPKQLVFLDSMKLLIINNDQNNVLLMDVENPGDKVVVLELGLPYSMLLLPDFDLFVVSSLITSARLVYFFRLSALTGNALPLTADDAVSVVTMPAGVTAYELMRGFAEGEIITNTVSGDECWRICVPGVGAGCEPTQLITAENTGANPIFRGMERLGEDFLLVDNQANKVRNN
jgi:hypothetical protein